MQGEGPHVGLPTAFVRFGECDLRCGWCDSPGTWLPARECRIETEAGSGHFEPVPNPVSLDTVMDALAALEVGPGEFVSLTGGEPLLQPDAVGELAEALRARGHRVHLETHGLHAEALARVVEHCDYVAMDWKLASDVRRRDDPKSGPVADFHDAHGAFLEIARRAPDCCVKVVVTDATREEELAEMCERIARVAPDVTLVLQPVTPFARVRERPSAARLLAWRRLCAERLRDVRVIPQTHPIYGAL